MYAVHVTPNVTEKDLPLLAKNDRKRALAKMTTLAVSPRRYKPLKGRLEGAWSLRVGNLRIISVIDETARRVVVISVGRRRGRHAGDVYAGVEVRLDAVIPESATSQEDGGR